MAITVQCKCGKRMSVADALAGKSVRCSKCGSSVLVTVAKTAAGKTPGRAPAASPAVYISPGKIVAAVVVVALIACGLAFYFGPMSVSAQWSKMDAKARDNIQFTIAYGLRAFLSEKGDWDPTKAHMVPSVESGAIIFNRPLLVMSMPQKVEFIGKSTQGDFKGEYNTKTGEVEADVAYGGYSVGGLVDVIKSNGTFHMIGRVTPDNQPEVEIGGKKVHVVVPENSGRLR